MSRTFTPDEIAYAMGREARTDAPPGHPRPIIPFALEPLRQRWLEGWQHMDRALEMLAQPRAPQS